MDTLKIIAGLRAERMRLDQALEVLEHLAKGGARRRGRPPAWLKNAPEVKRRGRPPGSKNKPRESAAA